MYVKSNEDEALPSSVGSFQLQVHFSVHFTEPCHWTNRIVYSNLRRKKKLTTLSSQRAPCSTKKNVQKDKIPTSRNGICPSEQLRTRRSKEGHTCRNAHSGENQNVLCTKRLLTKQFNYKSEVAAHFVSSGKFNSHQKECAYDSKLR